MKHKNIVRPIFMVTFAFIATIAILHIHAATSVTSFEAENGTLSAGASLVSGVNQSGGKAVKFSAGGASGSCELSSILVNPCRPWLGGRALVYPQVASDVKSQQLYLEQRIGRQDDIIHTYNTPGDVLDSAELYFINRAQTLLFANWKPAGNWASAAGAANGGSASVDSDIDNMGRSIKAVAPHKIFMTIWHEPQNDVSSGDDADCGAGYNYQGNAGTPAQYRAMWANVENRFNALGVNNVVWVIDFQNQPSLMCLSDALYPGNSLVDWVMSNGYGNPQKNNFVTNLNTGTGFYKYFTDHSDTTHDYLSKPWGIVEWNIHNASTAQAVDYYNQAKAALDANTFPKLKDWMIFDSIGPDGNDNRVAYDFNNGGTAFFSQAKQDGYNKFANDPIFTGSWTDPSQGVN